MMSRIVLTRPRRKLRMVYSPGRLTRQRWKRCLQSLVRLVPTNIKGKSTSPHFACATTDLQKISISNGFLQKSTMKARLSYFENLIVGTRPEYTQIPPLHRVNIVKRQKASTQRHKTGTTCYRTGSLQSVMHKGK